MIGQQVQQAQQGRQIPLGQQPGPGGPGPGGQPQQGPPQQGQGQTYPADQNERDQFINDLTNALYSEGQPTKLVEMLKSGDEPGMAIGTVAATTVMGILDRRRSQTGGRKPHIKMIQLGLQIVFKEIMAIAQKVGIPISEKNMEVAAKVAGKLIQEGQAQKQGGQGQGGPPRQGGGPPQQGAPPPGGGPPQGPGPGGPPQQGGGLIQQQMMRR